MKETKIKYRQRMIKDVISKDLSTNLFVDKAVVEAYPISFYSLYFTVWLKLVDNM